MHLDAHALLTLLRFRLGDVFRSTLTFRERNYISALLLRMTTTPPCRASSLWMGCPVASNRRTVYREAYGLVADEIIEVYSVAVYGTWLWLATGQSRETQQ